MSKKERVKSKIDLLKTFIVACLTALFGVVSFAGSLAYTARFLSRI